MRTDKSLSPEPKELAILHTFIVDNTIERFVHYTELQLIIARKVGDKIEYIRGIGNRNITFHLVLLTIKIAIVSTLFVVFN